METKDLKVGDYGTFSVLKKLSFPNSGIISLDTSWLLQCSCGNKFKASSRHIKKRFNKKTKGCRKCFQTGRKSNNRTDNPGLIAQKYLYISYRCRAKKKGLRFKLTLEDFINISIKNCFWCGQQPSILSKAYPKGKVSKEWEEKAIFLRNTIDRLDSKRGYFKKNCVASCKTCNIAKHIMSEEDFQKWIYKVYNYMVMKGWKSVN